MNFFNLDQVVIHNFPSLGLFISLLSYQKDVYFLSLRMATIRDFSSEYPLTSKNRSKVWIHSRYTSGFKVPSEFRDQSSCLLSHP